MIPTEQNKEIIIASKEIILAISSQPWRNDNAQVSNQQLIWLWKLKDRLFPLTLQREL